ncbi:hypothetical protein J3R83DRAFT_1457 [Lanmaoa asiatica]|nr:hypothetical protein J3R83DRAFT_1457 [Lanmaoa asiatica]
MSVKTQVFITGATGMSQVFIGCYPYLSFISPAGYIAGCVLDRLLRHPTFATSEVTALIRKADKAPAFESLGVKTVLGSYDDHALLEKQASLSDVIFACADADNAEACAAILRGLKKRHKATGKVPILIHTPIIVDYTEGNYATETVWDDTDVAKLDTIADTQLHRNSQGYVKTYIVLPSTIYGFASGKLVDLGAQNARSIQMPLAVTASIARKRGGYVGQGLNMWPNVHIDDSEFPVCSTLRIEKAHLRDHDWQLRISISSFMMPSWKETRATGHEGLYFGENGHHLLKDVAAKIGEALYDLGVSETPEPNAFTEADYKKFSPVRVHE